MRERGGERVVVTAGLSWGRIVDKREEVGRIKLEYKEKKRKI